MTKYFSLIISWVCLLILIIIPVTAIWLLFDHDSLVKITQKNLPIPIPIIWDSVERWQWIGFWMITVMHMSIGLFGLLFLRRAFNNFAKGRLFDLSNTIDLRRFSIFVLIQSLTVPIYYSCISVLLSWQHPAGQKMLSIFFGSNELRGIFLALIVWVVSNLLIQGEQLKKENQQFV